MKTTFGFIAYLILAYFIGAMFGEAFGQEYLSGTASVIDGDTLEIHGQRIRLHGVDAPETRQPCFNETGAEWRCGKDAAFALSDFIAGSPVTCSSITNDRYGRVVAKCSVRGTDIEDWLVRHGWAMAYRKYSWDYVSAEADAQNRRVGIWRGTFQPPWEFRHSRRSSSPFSGFNF